MYNAYSFVCVYSVNIYIYSVYVPVFVLFLELNSFLNKAKCRHKIYYVYKLIAIRANAKEIQASRANLLPFENLIKDCCLIQFWSYSGPK